MNSGYLHFPEFDPVIFSIGPVALHWYGLMYLVGFIFAMWLAGRRASRPGSGWTKNEVENLLYAGFLGVFLGGRIGYVLFYNFPVFLSDPLYLFRVWDGGMSFHGGLIGVILVMVIFAYRTKRHFFQVADFIAPLIPFGLGAGRLGFLDVYAGLYRAGQLPSVVHHLLCADCGGLCLDPVEQNPLR
jgi:phosphatidylglycerol:prolipoprotein diacylglycerol transferase